MLVIEVIPFHSHKERLKTVKNIDKPNTFTIHDNYICVYKQSKTRMFEREGYSNVI